MRSRVFAWGLILALCLAGCRTYPKWNEPLSSYNPEYGYRFGNLEHEDNSDSLFVILTFSGGGTRAAALAYGVLERLARTHVVWEGRTVSLLDEVDVVSSVSGGSLTAAYFGLHGPRAFNDFPERVLYRDVQGDLVSALIRGKNVVRLASPFFGRTNLMAEQFNETVFDGRTYGDIVARGRRPFVIVNATDLGLGMPFEFTQAQFDLIASDLSSYSIAAAVAASSAYPGYLTPITLRNYAPEAGFPQPDWIGEALSNGHRGSPGYDFAEAMDSYADAERRYIHLADGGISDNLGLTPVIRSLRGQHLDWSVLRLIEAEKVRKVVIIAVNARGASSSDWETRAEIVPLLPLLDIVSSIPVGNNSQGLLDYLRLLIEEREEDLQIRREIEALLGPAASARIQVLDGIHPVDYYLVEVAFNQLTDEARRRRFSAIPTSFRLDRATVDSLRAVAGEILDDHAEFRRLVDELQPRAEVLD